MPKITSVEPQKILRLRSERRFNVYLDGEFVFGADEDLVVEHRLVVGKVLDESDKEKLLFEVEVGKLMERLYRLFNIRPRSEKEVRDYLRNLSFKRKIKDQGEISEQAIELLVNKLNQKGLLNDEQFARSWVESRRKKKGLRVLKQELFQKGISKEIIEEVISEQVVGYSGQEVAEKLLEKKMRAWKNLPPMEFKKKAFDFLFRRGFEYAQVKNIVENTLRKR